MKRPLLSTEDRDRLRAMAARAARHAEERTTDPAYSRGVVDVLRWLADNEEPTALLREVTR